MIKPGFTFAAVRDDDPLAYECEQAHLLAKAAQQRIERALAIADGQVEPHAQKARDDLRNQLEQVLADLDKAAAWAANVIGVRVAEVTGDTGEWDD